MWVAPQLDDSLPKPELYRLLHAQLHSLLGDERDRIANLANTAALLFHSLPDVNWAGFYLLKDNDLVLGPFQGAPACIRIPLGRGVCGTAAARRTTLRVANVETFPGHIACDSASRSEIVIPLRTADGDLAGVLDVDSPLLDRFDEEDQVGLEAIADKLAAKL